MYKMKFLQVFEKNRFLHAKSYVTTT